MQWNYPTIHFPVRLATILTELALLVALTMPNRCFVSADVQGIEQWHDSFEDTVGVGDRVKSVPLPLYMYTANGSRIFPGQTVRTGEITDVPTLIWDCNPDKLYLLLLMDKEGLEKEDPEFLNYLAYNIPGCQVEKGFQALDYIEPFVFKRKEDNVTLDTSYTKAVVFLVFEQNSTDPMDLTGTEQHGCADYTDGKRKVVISELQKTNDLIGPVGGNVFVNVYSGTDTITKICEFSRCVGRRWPANIRGVNDGPDCAPAQQSAAVPSTQKHLVTLVTMVLVGMFLAEDARVQ